MNITVNALDWEILNDKYNALMSRHWQQIEVIRNRIDNGGLTADEKRLLRDLGFETSYDVRGLRIVK